VSGTVIYKMTGSGNDFVFVDGRVEPVELWPPKRIRAYCRRRTGIGADGLVVLEPGSEPGAVRFHFFNSDGGRAPMCGNGSLCATRLAAWLELAPADGMILETDAGAFRTRCVPGEAERAEIVLSDIPGLEAPSIELAPGENHIRLGVIGMADLPGIPHLVVLVDDVRAVNVAERGRALRYHEAIAPAGANVNFVSQAEGGGWTMRTYERGVEGETLACGTGAVTSAAVLAAAGEIHLPWDVVTTAGYRLTISGRARNGTKGAVLAEPTLAGEARIVYRAAVGAEPPDLG
jgi:diaminopimelate epimerase